MVERLEERRGDHDPESEVPKERARQIQTGAAHLALVGLDLDTIVGQGDFWQEEDDPGCDRLSLQQRLPEQEVRLVQVALQLPGICIRVLW